MNFTHWLHQVISFDSPLRLTYSSLLGSGPDIHGFPSAHAAKVFYLLEKLYQIHPLMLLEKLEHHLEILNTKYNDMVLSFR